MVRSTHVLVPVVALAALSPAQGFLPSSKGLCPVCPTAVRSVSLQMSSSRGPSSDENIRAKKTLSGSGELKPSPSGGLSKCLDVLGRSFAASATLLSICFSSPAPSEALDIGRFGRQGTVDQKTVVKQLQRVDKQEQQEMRDAVKDPTNVIAKGIVRLPEIEGYPLGPSTPSALNYALENDNAALLIACYGREGGPVAAKKIPLRGLEFPFAFELTADNLLFPLTKATWEKDNRAPDDLGISVLLDLDGKFASANENDLIGFGISKPVDIAGSQIRRDALIQVQPRTGVKQYTEDEQKVLGSIDLEIERQAAGGSLAQLAASPTSTIEVLTNDKDSKISEEDLAGLE